MSEVGPEEDTLRFGRDEILVSKTDTRGRMVYVNDTFVRVSGYSRERLIDAPHSLIRHPDMPHGLFRYMWNALEAGEETFMYVRNRREDGRDYWVLAHVTPTVDGRGVLRGYHSTRRLPDTRAIEAVRPIYARMRQAEASCRNRAEAARQGLAALERQLADWGQTYPEVVWSLINATPDDVPQVVRKDRSGRPIGTVPLV